MTYTFRPANDVEGDRHLLIALSGPSGGGKTYTALRLATGLGGKIAFIDTEGGRGLHYREQFEYDYTELKAPFRPSVYSDAILDAEKAGYSNIIIDSASHEYEGEGGILEWADAELEKPNVKSPAHWKEPKGAHKKMMARLLQCRANLIFCLRADEKISIQPNPNKPGRTIVVPAGWQPICEKRFMYEMTCSFLLLDDKPGIPRPIKLQDQHKPCFPDGEHISEDSGKRLAAWASDGSKLAAATAGDNQPDMSTSNEESPSDRQFRIYHDALAKAGDANTLKQAWGQMYPHLGALTAEQQSALTAAKDQRKAELLEAA